MKNEKSLKNDKRAVSPVIGVILMVAITVILAAVIAAFVFGFGTPAQAPYVGFQLSNNPVTTDKYNDATIDITAGEYIPAANYQYIIWRDGDEQPTDWNTGDDDMFAGQAMVWESTGGNVTAGLYHVKVLHVPSGTIMLDTSVTTS